MYKIEYTRQVLKNIEKFPKKDKLAILEKIESLASTPRPEGVVSMKGQYAGYYRIRVGIYRVIYHIQDQQLVILIVKIAHRGRIHN